MYFLVLSWPLRVVTSSLSLLSQQSSSLLLPKLGFWTGMTSPHQFRSIGTRSMSASSASGSSSRWTPITVPRPFGNEEEEEDDDRTLVMSARSTNTEAKFGMMDGEFGEEGDTVAREEEEGLLEDEEGRRGKLGRDTTTEGIEKMQAERLEEVDFEDEQALGGHWTTREEKDVVKKMDRRVVLFVALLYLLSFLDRSNIGNARIAGLEVDLRLGEGQYEWLLSAFYITYIAFEWMALLYVFRLDSVGMHR